MSEMLSEADFLAAQRALSLKQHRVLLSGQCWCTRVWKDGQYGIAKTCQRCAVIAEYVALNGFVA